MNNINKLTILTLLLLSMTTAMSNVAIVTSLPHLKEYFNHIDNIEFYSRLMLTLPSLLIAILAPILGHIIFRYGKKKSAIAALFFFALLGTTGLYLENLELLLLSRALFGLCIATLMIVSTSLVGDYFKGEERHKFMGYQSAFMAIGGVLFVIGGGILSDINWRLPFGIYLVGIVLLPFTFFYLKEVKIEEEIQQEEISINTNIIFIYILAFFYMLIFFILPTQIPFLLIESFNASGTLTGSIIAMAFLSNALGAISFSKLKTRFDYPTITVIATFIIGLGFVGIGLVNNVYFFFCTSPLLGFGGGIMMTNVTAWMLSKTTLEKRIKTTGYYTSSLYLGQFLSPILFHPLVSILPIQKFFLLVGVSLFIVSFISIFFLKKNKYE